PIQPRPRGRCTGGATIGLCPAGVLAPRKPMVGSFPGCCARAASGHAAAPPSAASNCRRPMVTVIRPSRARCVKVTVPRHERGVFFAFKEGRNSRWGCVARDARGSALLGLDVGGPDHFCPSLGVISDKLPELGGRENKRRNAQIGIARLDCRAY